MFTLIGIGLPAVTTLFAAIMPLLFVSLGALLSFAIGRAAQLPRYITALVVIYQDSAPDSETRKYLTAGLLILGSILTFMAHSFVPFTGVPVIGVVTTPIALLLASLVILATLDLIAKLNEPYLSNFKTIYNEEFNNMNDDLLTLKNMLGPSWNELTQKVQNVFKDLIPKIADLGNDLSNEINQYFSTHLSDLTVYVSHDDSTKNVLTKSEVKVITESLKPWEKVGGSLALSAITGAGSGMLASSMATASLAPATWWTPFVPGAIQGIIFGGRTIVSAATFSLCTVAAPIALGLTIGSVVFSTTMFTLGKVEEQKLSQFLADVIIASIPMIRADGELSEEEKMSIKNLLTNPKIRQDDKARVEGALNSHDTFDDIIAKNLIHQDKEEKALIKRRLILAITWEIAKADGKIDERETILHNRMSRILQVPRETVVEVRRLITPQLALSSSL